jgi:hypothetical protein
MQDPKHIKSKCPKLSDDLGSGWIRGQNPKPRDNEPANTYHEQDQHLWSLQALYGKQEPTQRFREGRPVRAEQEQTESRQWQRRKTRPQSQKN